MSEFYEGLAEILEVDVVEVNPEFNLQSTGWDSLAVVSTIALVDDCFGIVLEGQALDDCETVGDIEKLVALKKKA